MISFVLLIVCGACTFLLASPDERILLFPILVSSAAVAAMIEFFWRRDRQLPVVDVGTLCALITLVYMALPAIFYIKAGLTFTMRGTDHRLAQMGTTPADVAAFLWFVTAYIVAITITYSLLRGAGMPGPRVTVSADAAAGWALATIIVLAAIYRAAVEHFYYVSLNPSNLYLQMNLSWLPRPVAQVSHNLLGIGQIALLGFIAYVFARRSWPLGIVLLAWIGWQLADTIVTLETMGARTYYATLIIAIILAGHRMIKPIGPVLASVIAISALGGLLGYGLIRAPRGAGISDIWSFSTEFQVLMANAINVAWEQARGALLDVPRQIIFNDLVLMIPQQLLPFPKLDASTWYLQQIAGQFGNLSPSMFGVAAQSRLGFGLPEIILRGIAVGAILAFIHRQCVKRADSLTAFIVYLWLCISVYYTYRASTFYIATWAIYRLLPFALLFWLLGWLFRSRSKTALTQPDLRAGDRAT